MVHASKMPRLGNALFVLACIISGTQEVQAGKPICPCDTDPGGCCPYLDYKLCPDFQCYNYGGYGDYSQELAYGDASECSLTCKEPRCGSHSVYTCGDTSRCQITCDGGTSCKNTVLDGSKSGTFEISSGREPLFEDFDIYLSIIHSSESEKCRLICGGAKDCNFAISVCKAPHHLLVCSGRDSCDNSLFYNENSKNSIFCTGSDSCSNSVFHNAHSFNEVFMRSGACEGSVWENDYSTNVFEVYEKCIEHCVFSNTHSYNEFICGYEDTCLESVFDNSYSKNVFHCTEFSCGNSKFDNSHSENKFFFDDDSCFECRLDNSYSKNQFFMDNESLEDSAVTNHDSVNNFTCLDESCSGSMFDNRRSYNEFFCADEGCESAVFDNTQSYNKFSCEIEGCNGAFFFNDESENIFHCTDESCEDVVFKNSYSKNTFICINDACESEAYFDNSYSKNDFVCSDFSCDSRSYFDNSYSENTFVCDDSSCDGSTTFDNSYSKNEFICTEDSCDNSIFKNTHSENIFSCDGNDSCEDSLLDNRHSRNKFVCESFSCREVIATNTYSENYWLCRGASCVDAIFDYSFSSTEHVCENDACANGVFYVNYAEKFDLSLQSNSFDSAEDVLIFCYDSNCQILCFDNSCFQLQYTCGGSYGRCLLSTQEMENHFFYHCYGGAHCELQCGYDCGLEDKESTLNCENAGYCCVDCGEGDCAYLRVQVDNSPILFKSNMEISENCTAIVRSGMYDHSYPTDYQPQYYEDTYDYQDYVFQALSSEYGPEKVENKFDYKYNHPEMKVSSESCAYLKNACREGLYLCNPAEYIKSSGNIAPVCAWSPYACPESDCHLSSLEIDGVNTEDANIDFDPFKYEYHISLRHKKSFIIEAHAVNSYSQIALGEMNARGSVRMTYGLALDGYGNSQVDISVCSPAKLTCEYKLYVHVEGQ